MPLVTWLGEKVHIVAGRTVGQILDELIEHGWQVSSGVSQFSTTNDDWLLHKNGDVLSIKGTRARHLSPMAEYNILIEGGVIGGP